MTTTALQEKINSANEPCLYMSMELSNKEWKLGFGIGGNPRLRTTPARDIIALSKEIALAKLKLGLLQEAKVVSCYEAGRDGFWIHRCLTGKEIANIVVDSSSIEVNRWKRRAKTDKVDKLHLQRLLWLVDVLQHHPTIADAAFSFCRPCAGTNRRGVENESFLQ